MSTPFLPRYQAGNSPLHRLDPRVKIITLLVLLVGIALTPADGWMAYPLIWTLLGSLAGLAGVSAWRLGRLAGLALPFTLAAVTLLITTPGQPIFYVGDFAVTDAGLARFLAIVLKSWLSVQAALLFAITTPMTDVLWALEGVGVPASLVAVIGFMYRYLFVLKDEAERLLRARAARSGGARAGGTLLWRAKIAGGMVGSLFLRSYERSERVYAAMTARGYTGQLKRQNIPPLRRQAVYQGAVPVIIMILIQIAISG